MYNFTPTIILLTTLFLTSVFSGCLASDDPPPAREVIVGYCLAVFHWKTEPTYVVNISWAEFQAGAPIMASQLARQVEQNGSADQLGGLCNEVMPEMQWLVAKYDSDRNATATEVLAGVRKYFFDIEYKGDIHRMSIHDDSNYHRYSTLSSQDRSNNQVDEPS